VAISADEKLKNLRPNRVSSKLKPALDTSRGLFDKLQLDNIKSNQRNTYDGKTEFNAIVLRQTIYFAGAEPNAPEVRVRARIPELHAHLPMPRSVNDHQIIDLYPEFIAETKESIGGKAMLPAGSIIVVSMVDKNQTSYRYNNGKIKEVISDKKANIQGFQEFTPFYDGKESKSAFGKEGKKPNCAEAKTAIKSATGEATAGKNKEMPASKDNPRKIQHSTDNSQVQPTTTTTKTRTPARKPEPGVFGTALNFWGRKVGLIAEKPKPIPPAKVDPRSNKVEKPKKIDCDKTFVVKDFPKDTNVQNLAEQCGIPVPVLRAFMKVESNGKPSAIRFEPHWFVGMRHLGGRYTIKGRKGFRPDLLGRIPYTPDPNRSNVSYTRRETNRAAFLRAFALDPRAAIKSSSFGKFQVMGWALLKAYGNDPQKAWEAFQKDPNTASDLMVVSWFQRFRSARRYANTKPEPNWLRLAAKYNGSGCCGDLPWTNRIERNKKRYHETLRKAWIAFGGAGS